MADNSTAIADLFPSLSPLDDPDQAALDRQGTMAKLLGDAAPKSWAEQAQDSINAQQPSAAQTPVVAQAPSSPTQTSAQPTAASPQPAVPAGVTPSGDAKGTNWADMQARNATAAMTSLDQGDTSLNAMRNQPDLGTATAGLEAQRAKDATPINPQAAQYKPTWGQRIMRGIEGVARGGILTPAAIVGALDPKAVGGTAYGAPNRQFGIDTSQQKANIASDDQQLTNAAANWKARSDAAKALAQETRSQAQGRQQLSGEITNQEKIPIQQQQADTERQNANTSQQNAQTELTKVQQSSPQGKTALTAAEFAEAQKEADRMGLKGTNRTLYLANGKIPDPRQATDDEIATAQAIKALGHQPTSLDEYNQVRQAAKGLMNKGGDANTEKEYMAAQKDLNSQFAGAQTQADALTTAQQELGSGAVGQALGTIKTLVGLAGGKGTGVRITQAELNSILHARGIQGDFEGYINGLEGKGSLSKDQLHDMQGLLSDVSDKVKEKMGLQDKYLDQLAKAKTVDEVRGVQSQYRKEFTGSGSGGTSHDIVVNPEDIPK